MKTIKINEPNRLWYDHSVSVIVDGYCNHASADLDSVITLDMGNNGAVESSNRILACNHPRCEAWKFADDSEDYTYPWRDECYIEK